MKRWKYYPALSSMLVTMMQPIIVSAVDMENDSVQLTYFFKQDAFQGALSIVSKFSWLGTLLQAIISAVCLLGLAMVAIQMFCTLMYFAGRQLFDQVYELKRNARGQRFAGIPTMVKAVGNGEYGAGLDAVFGFFMMLLPDVKKWSEYNPENMKGTFSEEDGILQYLMKGSLNKILIIFALAIGWNGAMLQAYGTCVDGMSVLVDRFVEVDLAGYIYKVVNQGSGYRFYFDDADTEWGKLQQDVAEDLYNEILYRIDVGDRTDTMKQAVGKAVETFVTNSLANYGVCSGLNIQEDEDVKALEAHAYIGTSVPEDSTGQKYFGTQIEIESDIKGEGFKSGQSMIVRVSRKRNTSSNNTLLDDETEKHINDGGSNNNGSVAIDLNEP